MFAFELLNLFKSQTMAAAAASSCVLLMYNYCTRHKRSKFESWETGKLAGFVSLFSMTGSDDDLLGVAGILTHPWSVSRLQYF